MNRGNGLCASITDTIAWTPSVELSRITKDLDGRIIGKCEFMCPGGAKKDRIAVQMIEDAEEQGVLKPGQTVVEMTSGNTGAGLAIVCGVKGYPFVAVMSKGNSIERGRMMHALGAELVLVDQVEGSLPGQVSGDDLMQVEYAAQKIVKERGAFRADQFELDGALTVHYHHTGTEMWEQSNGTIDAFCDYAGTGGTFSGCAQLFKDKNPDVQCYVIEPTSCAVLAGKPITSTGHKIQGGGYSRTELSHFDKSVCDGYLTVTNEEAIATARRLAKEEGIFAGFSSGANLHGAIQLLKGPCKGMTIACVLCDSGLKYLSTDLYE